MSPTHAGKRGRRRPTRRRSSGGALGGILRWLVCFVLVGLLVLFVASVTGQLERRAPQRGERVGADGWEIPSRRLDVTTPGEPLAGGLAAQVSRLAEGVRGEGAASEGAGDEQPGGGAASTQGTESAPVRAQVILANGCGVNRLVARLTPLVRGGGFDVCGVSDADRRDYRETLIVDRCGDRGRAEAVAAYFRQRWGVGRVLTQVRRAPEADVLVVIGSDLGASFEIAQP